MSSETRNEESISRREMLTGPGKGAIVAGTIAVATGGGSALLASTAAAAEGSFSLKPGELDDYYGFWSSGQAGEMRIMGVPSMRELMRVPVFNRCSATGWGDTNESKKILTDGLMPETKAFLAKRGMKTYHNGDLHHPHMSFTDARYSNSW